METISGLFRLINNFFEVTVSETDLPLGKWKKVGSSRWRGVKFLPQTAAWLPGSPAEQGCGCRSEFVNSPTLFSIVSTKGSEKIKAGAGVPF